MEVGLGGGIGVEAVNYTIVLEDTFFVVRKQNIREHLVTLQNKKLCIKSTTAVVNGKVKSDYISAADIIGCHVCERLDNSLLKRIPNCRPSSQRNSDLSSLSDPAVYLRVFSYPLKYRLKGLTRNQHREKKVLSFKFVKSQVKDENLDLALKWRTSILWVSRGVTTIPPSPPTPRNLLVLVNPFSGHGKALNIFQEQVVPMLDESDTLYHLLITDRANCARDYIRERDLSEWDGIVVVSGDGLLFEVFNGLMEREDWETSIKTPVAIVPGGSGNGLAMAINYALGEPAHVNIVTSASLNVVRGRLSPMDLVRVETPTSVIYSFLSVGWGIMSDIDIESERLRALGAVRFTLWAFIRAIGLRHYPGKLSYLPIKGYVAPKKKLARNNWTKLKRSQTVTSECMSDEIPTLISCRSLSLHNTSCDETDRAKVPEEVEIAFEASDVLDIENLEFRTQKATILTSSLNEEDRSQHILGSDVQEIFPSLDGPVPTTWSVIEGDFILVYSSQQTHLSSDVLFAPDAKLDDGIMWLVIIRAGVRRSQVVQFLLSLESGSHVHIPFVDVIPVSAFRLEPLTGDGYLTVDGESIECTRVQAQVLPSMARIMTR